MNMPNASPLIEDHLRTPLPSTLWHYTSMAGALGILQSEKIFATEVHFLNDREEFDHALRKFENILESEIPEKVGPYDFPARGFLKSITPNGVFQKTPRVCIASFTELGDQLSQWRGYSGGSTGVSLGFNLEPFRPTELATAVVFAPCVYEEKRKNSLVQEACSHVLEDSQRWWESARADPTSRSDAALLEILEHGLANTRFRFLQIAALLKHPAFSEEREWRLVLAWDPDHPPVQHRLLYHASRDCIRPRIEFPLPKDSANLLTLTAVTLGPGAHRSSLRGMEMLLQSMGLSVEPRHSDVPYEAG